MEIINVKPVIQAWLYPRHVAVLIGAKATKTSNFLRDFEAFVAKRPNYFNPVKPMITGEGRDAMYNFYAIAHYHENKDLLDAGTRSLNFKEDLKRLKEAY